MPLKFSRHTISSEAFESAGVFDVDGDGVLDIVSGEFWYQGPDFRKRHRMGDVRRVGEYYDDFSTIAMDVNGDGRMDFITGGMWGETLVWRENPGAAGEEWPAHVIGKCGGVESTRAWDIDGDGELEIVPNTPNFPLTAYKLSRGTGTFSAHTLFPKAHGHGLGFGDIDGDGRGDFVFCNGWLQAPARSLPSPLVREGLGVRGPVRDDWIFHPEFDLGCASVPIIVADVNGDGVNDLIVGQAHGYGLDWWEQKREAGKRRWIRHPIDPLNSQYHDMQWADIDGDGKRAGYRQALPCAQRPRSGRVRRCGHLLLQMEWRVVQQADRCLWPAGRGQRLRHSLRARRSAWNREARHRRAGQGWPVRLLQRRRLK
jgi:hypothetical protein